MCLLPNIFCKRYSGRVTIHYSPFTIHNTPLTIHFSSSKPKKAAFKKTAFLFSYLIVSVVVYFGLSSRQAGNRHTVR